MTGIKAEVYVHEMCHAFEAIPHSSLGTHNNIVFTYKNVKHDLSFEHAAIKLFTILIENYFPNY